MSRQGNRDTSVGKVYIDSVRSESFLSNDGDNVDRQSGEFDARIVWRLFKKGKEHG